jgi:SNF2 family DNA or RNA helicase
MSMSKEVIEIDDSSDEEKEEVIAAAKKTKVVLDQHDSDVEDLTISMTTQANISSNKNCGDESSSKQKRKEAANKRFGALGLSYLDSSSSDDDDSSIEVFEPTFSTNKTPSKLKPRDDEIICVDENDYSYEDDAAPTKISSSGTSWVYNEDYHEYYLKSNDKKVKIPGLRIPSKLYKELFDHQKAGVAWMAGLHSNRIGGLLGDDMGK